MAVKDDNAELNALRKAKAILLKKSALVQARTRVHAGAEDEDPKSRVLRSIEQLGRKFHSTSLVSLAYRAGAAGLHRHAQVSACQI